MLSNTSLPPSAKSCMPWIVAVALLMFSIGIFYPRVASLQGGLLSGDHREQHYPWASYLDDSLARGELPWWTWKIHSGFPLLAEGQVGAFYPPNLLLHSALPADVAYSAGFLVHFFLSGLFMILYCRGLRLRWVSTATATLCFLYGNAFGGAYYNFTSLKTLCWFPLSLFLIDKLRATGRVRFGLLLGLVFGLQLLAGYLQMAVYAIGMALVYSLLKVCIKDPLKPSGSGSPSSVKILWGFSLSLVVTALVFMPQFLATYPLSRLSGRVGLEESFAYLNSFPPWGLASVFFPKTEGLLKTLGLYVGIFPLFLVFLSAGFCREPSVGRWWIMLVLALLLAMGGYSPLYVGLVKLSHFYGFRVPSKLLFYANTAMSVLAGWGIEAVMRNALSPTAWRRAKGWFFALGISALFFGLFGGLLLEFFKADILQFGYGMVERKIYNRPYHPHSLEHYRASVDSYFRLGQDILNPRNTVMAMPLMILAVVLLVLLYFTPTRRKCAIVASCLILSAGDLYAYHFINKMVGDISSYEEVKTPDPIVSFLQRDTALYRIISYRRSFEDLSIVPSYNMLFGVEDVGAYSPFVLRRYRDLLEGLGAVDDSTGRIVESPEKALEKLPLLSSMNVKYLLSKREISLPGLAEVFSTQEEHLYQNPHVQDRFFFVRDVHVEEDSDLLLSKVRGMDFDSMRDIWVEKSIPQLAAQRSAGRVEALKFEDSRIVLEVSCSEPGLLYGSILYYPGIVAHLDGIPLEIYQANYCFSVLQVPAGRHTIIVTFDWKKSLGWPLAPP